MPLIDDTPLNEFVSPIPTAPLAKKPEPSFGEIVSASLRQENDMVAAVDLLSQPKWKADTRFDLLEEAKKREVDPQDFTNAVNPEHLDFLIKKRDQEVKDNSTLDEAGWLGFTARVASGLVSPTTLIPMVGAEGTGLKVVGAVAANAALGAGIQEGILYADQQTRTKEQVAFSLAASTVLGGVLGAVSHTLSKSVVDKIAHDMVNSRGELAISPPLGGVSDAGAKEAGHLQDAGQLKNGWGARALAPLSPITRGFQQWNAPAYIREMGGSQQLRKMTAGFSQGSLALEENKKFLAASPGGNVEDLKRTYAAVSYAGSKSIEKGYVEYILGAGVGGFMKKQRAILAGASRPDGKLTFAEFKRQIALDMWSNFTLEGVPDAVRKTAKEIDTKVYKKLYDEGVEVGIFTGKEKTVGDENYANRVYNNEVIMRRHNEFVKILADHFSEKLNTEFNTKLGKLQEMMQRDKQLFEDMNLPFEKAQQLRDDLLNAGVDLTDATNPEVIKGVQTLKDNAKTVKALQAEYDNLKKIKVEGSDLEGLKSRTDRLAEIEAALKAKALESEGVRKTLGTELEKYQLAAKEIRRRLNNLNKNIGIQDVKLQKKLDKIAGNEDAQVATILRANKQLQKFLKMLESASDDKIDAAIGKLRGDFAESSAKMDKLEEAYRKLEDEFNGTTSPPKEPPTDGGGTPPKVGPDGTPPKVEPPPPEPPKLSPEQETRVTDIVRSNIESAFDTHQDYAGIDDALREHEKNIYDTIKEEFPQDSVERELAFARAEAEIKAEIARMTKKYDKIKSEEDWVAKRPELFGVSKRDMDDAGLLKVERDEVIANPAKFENFLELVKRGYHNFDGVFRQVTDADVAAITKKMEDFDLHKMQDDVYNLFDGIDPNEKLIDPRSGNKMTRQEMLDKIFDDYSEITVQVSRLERSLDKAYKFPDPKIEPPKPPKEPVTGDPLTNKLHPNLSTAVEYFRTARDAADWFQKYGDTYERVMAQRIVDYLGDTSFYIIDPKLKDALEKNIGQAKGRFKRQTYEPMSGRKEDGIRSVVTIAKNNADRITIMHELLHAATAAKLDLGKHFGQRFPRLKKLYEEMEDIRYAAKNEIAKMEANGEVIPFYVRYSTQDVHELVANMMDPQVRDFYRRLKYKNKPFYSKFVEIMRGLLGIPKGEESAFAAVMDAADRVMRSGEGNFKKYAYELPRKFVHRDGITLYLDNPPAMQELAQLREKIKPGEVDLVNEHRPFMPRPQRQDPAAKIEGKMEKLADKMDKIARRLGEIESVDRVKWRAELQDMMKELADTHAKINAKRAVRNEKLWKQVEHLSPEARAKRMAAFELKMNERPGKFIDRWNTKTSGDLKFNAKTGLLEGNGDFTAYATDRAREVVDKIRGTDRRLAYSDLIREKRGPELARLLDIPSEKIKDFLETDIEKMLAIYTRTVGSDISVARVFGSPDAAEDFVKLGDERQRMLEKIDTMVDKEGKPLSEEAKQDLQYKTNKFYDDARKDLEVLLERAKGTRGIPRDASSWSARGAKMAMDLNFMRMMGNVIISSVADPARLVMKYGLTRTLRDGFLPLITSFKELRMSQHEALLAGSGLDPILHSRAYSMFDIFDDAHRGTPVEKAVHWASTKMGLIAGFDHWTSAMKQLTAGVANAKLLDNIAAVMEGTVTGRRLEKAQEFLAKNNLDADLVERIWKEVTNGEGGGKVNGVWLPNTDNWTDLGAQRAYRAALGGEIDATIITPGFERPNWVDSSIPARMVAQFKSFGFTSTQKTLMAGLQEHDLAFFNGVAASLALGALSYYLYATIAGGKTYEEMMNAGPDKWADEAISRSGVTGIFDEAQRIANRIPLLQQYASFSGKQTTRRGGGGLVGETLGPSFDLLERVFKVTTEIDEPTKSTLRTIRTLLPLQNVFYLRQLLDKIEEAAGSGLPDRRGQ